MAIREGAWDCPHCGMERNRGPERFCGGCGAPRGEDVKFYLPEDARVVREEEEVKRAKGGPDWNCSYCGGDNYGYNNYCTGCGGPRDGSADKEGKEYKAGAIPRSQEDLDKKERVPKEDKESKRKASPKKEPEKKSGPSSLLKIGGGVGCAALICIILVGLCIFSFFAFRTQEVSLKVTGLSWERTVEIEELRTITEKGWEGELPSDARYISESREVHHYEKVQVGTETKTETVTEKVQTGTEKVKVGVKDLGNGYFEDVYETRPVYKNVQKKVTKDVPVYKDEPVYKNKITYEVDRWQTDRTEKSSGIDNEKPYWPEFTLSGKEREGNKTEIYMVTLAGPEGKSYDYKAKSENEWDKFEMGKSYNAKISGFGSLKSVEVD